MPPDALRDQIAAEIREGLFANTPDEIADAILALVRKHATSVAAVEKAMKEMNMRAIWPRVRDMRAAIVAALGGSS